ncbi:MAG TPA: biopolymer transporter TolR, partial [Cyclobacteriaceae bacterium]|nr:biopolymer transporter TolR [Cyclobacteriaceae bacterium]
MKNNHLLLLVLFSFFINATYSQRISKIGLFDERTDVGNSPIEGKVVYNPETQEYLLGGAGINMWANTDQFNFLWKKIKGDFTIS